MRLFFSTLRRCPEKSWCPSDICKAHKANHLSWKMYTLLSFCSSRATRDIFACSYVCTSVVFAKIILIGIRCDISVQQLFGSSDALHTVLDLEQKPIEREMAIGTYRYHPPSDIDMSDAPDSLESMPFAEYLYVCGETSKAVINHVPGFSRYLSSTASRIWSTNNMSRKHVQ